jgi:type IV pilus assembly protein PilQ
MSEADGPQLSRKVLEVSVCGPKSNGLSTFAGRGTSTNRLVIALALVALLLASAEAEEFVAPDNGVCSPANEAGRATGKEAYTGQKISLDFKDADIVNVLRILSEIGGQNIVITDDVKGRITLRLVDVPWDQALDVVLQTNGLECVKIGNVRRVSTITRVTEEHETKLAAEAAAGELEPLETAEIHANYRPVAK